MAIALDSANAGGQVSNTVLSWSHTCGAGASILIVLIGVVDSTLADRTISGVTYNGDALTNSGITCDDATNGFRTEIWYRINPDTGSAYTITVTAGGKCTDIAGSSLSLTGTHATTPIGDTATEADTIYHPAITVANTVDTSMIIAAIVTDQAAGADIAANNFEIGEQDVGADVFSAQYKLAVTGNTAIGWTDTSTQAYVISAVEILVGGASDPSVSKTEKTTVRDILTVQFDLFNAAGIDRATVRDISTVQFDAFNAAGIDKATVRDIVSIFLSVIFLSKTDKATIQDIATIVFSEVLPIAPSVHLLNEDDTHLLTEDGLFFATEGGPTEYSTIKDVLTIILDVLCPSKTDKATVKDVLTVYFDRWLASKADTATIKDTLAIFLDLFFTSKADTATVRDVASVMYGQLVHSDVDTITTRDVLTVILDKFNVSKADTATARDVLSVILDAFIPSFTDKATIQEIAAVMLDKMLVSNVDTATIQDTFTLVFDKLIQHSTENLTVQDIITLQMNLYNVPGIDRATLRDISTLILDKLNVPGIDRTSVRDVFTLIFDKFLATGIDYATTQDIATLLLWFDSCQVGRGDYSTLRDRVLISLSGIAGITIYHIPTIPNLGSFSGRIGGRKHISLS